MEFLFGPTVISYLILIVFVLPYLPSVVTLLSIPSSIGLPGSKSRDYFRRLWFYTKAWASGHKGLLDGYDEHSKLGKPFIISSPGLSPSVMLPQSYQKWLVSHPDSILSQRIANVESYALNYLFPSVDMHNEVMINVVKRYMSGRISLVQGEMYEQMHSLIHKRLGTDGGWKTIDLPRFVRDVVVRTGYRIHVGEPLCNDEAFIHASWNMTLWAGIGTMIVGQFSPASLKWPLGWLCSLPITYNIRRYRKIIQPIFEERLQSMARKKDDPLFDYEPPQDAMTWTVRILQERNPEGTTLESIIDNFMTIFTAAFATIPVTLHVLLNLLGLPEAQEYLPLLREEVLRTFEDASAWTAPQTTAPGQMSLLEAFLRESMRYTPFFTRGQEHKVVNKEGIDLPDGTHVGHGVFLACPVAGITADEDFYADPKVFSPFRFLEEVIVDGEPSKKKYVLKSNSQLTSPSDIFIGFGFGRHACPGRFFAARIMKLMVSYLLFHYELEPLAGGRPKNFVVGSFTIPPMFSTVKVRRVPSHK